MRRNNISTGITQALNINYPIIQGGMIWVAGAKLAAAVSNAGGLGLVGAGSMEPDLFQEHIRKTKQLTNKPFGVNLPLIYKHIEDCIKIAINEDVKIIFSSAGSPKKFIKLFKDNGCTVAHSVPSPELAIKCDVAGVDIIVAEGTEAGGHNGKEQITTMCLVPLVKKVTSLPVIAAGGIATGYAIAAAIALGADGVQIGTRFAVTKESSAHDNYKNACVHSSSNATSLIFRNFLPIRALNNKFVQKAKELESKGASNEELSNLLGCNRSKKGIFEGDLNDGDLEAGQIAGLVNDIPTVNELMSHFVQDYLDAISKLNNTI